MSEIVPWTDPGGTSCCCCDLGLPYVRYAAITQAQYEMFRGGGSLIVGAHAIEASTTFDGFLPGLGGPYTANVSYAAKRKARIGINGPDSIALFDQAVADGYMSSGLAYAIKSLNCYTQTNQLPVYRGFDFGQEVPDSFEYLNCSTDFGYCLVNLDNYPFGFTGEAYIYNYGHVVRKQPQTIDGVFSEYWFLYYVNTGIGLIFDAENQPNYFGATIYGSMFVTLRSRDGTLFTGNPAPTTGDNITIDLQTPEGNIPLLLTDDSRASDNSTGFVSEWIEYPTFAFTPSAP